MRFSGVHPALRHGCKRAFEPKRRTPCRFPAPITPPARRLSQTPPPRCSGGSGNAASVETALRANGAEQITLLHVQPDEKSIRCAEKLAQLFEVKQILVPNTVYYPAENAAFYDFSYVGVLPSGSFTVTDGGETVTFTVNGTEIYLETKRSTSLSHDTDILVTENRKVRSLPRLRF